MYKGKLLRKSQNSAAPALTISGKTAITSRPSPTPTIVAVKELLLTPMMIDQPQQNQPQQQKQDLAVLSELQFREFQHEVFMMRCVSIFIFFV